MSILKRLNFQKKKPVKNPVFGRSSCFGYEDKGKTWGLRNLVIFKNTAINNHINEKVSLRAFH